MYRSEFVHVVALIRSASGVQKRTGTGNQQGRFVHGHGVRSGEERTGFAVFEYAVGETECVVGCELVRQTASLTDETACEACAVRDV